MSACAVWTGAYSGALHRDLKSLKPSEVDRTLTAAFTKKKAGNAGFFKVLQQMNRLTGCPSAP